MNLSWNEFKNICVSKILNIQFSDAGNAYILEAIDGAQKIECYIEKKIKSYYNTEHTKTETYLDAEGVEQTRDVIYYTQHESESINPDATNFEDNCKNSCNKKVENIKPFADASGYTAKHKGFVSGACNDYMTIHNFKITQELYINGVSLICNGAAAKDKVDFNIVDVENKLGYGANFLLHNFAEDWNIDHIISQQKEVISPFLAKIPKDLYIQVIYKRESITSCYFLLNLLCYKKIS